MHFKYSAHNKISQITIKVINLNESDTETINLGYNWIRLIINAVFQLE